MSCSLLPLSYPPPSSSSFPTKISSSHPLPIFRLSRKQLANIVLHRSNSQAFCVYAARGKDAKRPEVIMVDPLEAKRLADKQMQEIQAEEKLKRQRRIEAINGAWAMIGLTAGLVVEGETGHGILAQLAGYLASISSFFRK